MKIDRIEITDKCWIYIDNIKVGNVQCACSEIQFIEQLRNLRIVDKCQIKYRNAYLGHLIEIVKSHINWEQWDKYKYDL